MNDSYKGKFLGWITTGLILVIVVGGTIAIYPLFRHENELKRKHDDLRWRIEVKKAEIAKLKEKQRRFREDKDFVEMIARQNQRIFPGELVFIFDGKGK